MREFDIFDFISTGRLGYIEIGSTESEVRRAFGQPKHVEEWMKGQSINPIAWKFDDLLIGFNKETQLVAFIGLRPKGIKKVFANIGRQNLVSRGLKFGVEIEEFEQKLKSLELHCIEKKQWDYHGWVLEFSSGVEVLFQGISADNAPLSEICLGCH